jgi:hypothetical protein
MLHFATLVREPGSTKLPAIPKPANQAEEEGHTKQRSGPRLGNTAAGGCFAPPRIINGHDIRIHRHGAVERQGSAAPNCCHGIERRWKGNSSHRRLFVTGLGTPGTFILMPLSTRWPSGETPIIMSLA